MSGLVKSTGGFLGLDTGDKAEPVQSGNKFLDQFGQMTGGKAYNSEQMNYENSFIAPSTGSEQATNQVLHNSLFGQGLGNIQTGLNQQQGQLQTGQGLQADQTNHLTGLQDQGFELKPEDQTLYGQTSGNIARMFGQQGNQASNNLAQRGLSNSGAAGATFSGLQGNQNEMLANAQQQIMQQRFQNTQNQIAQQQQFIGSLNSQNNQAAQGYSGAANNQANTMSNMVNQQYGRQLEGGKQMSDNLATGANLQNQANSGANSANMAASQYNTANTPMNFMDSAIGGVNTAVGASGKSVGQAGGAKAAGAMGLM